MANDTRSSRKIKDNENTNSKGKHISGTESTSLGSGASESSSLRRSARETPLKRKLAPSPSSTRKSERLEKRTSTPTVKRKSERIEKRMPSPLRRSERGKNHCSSSSSGSKKSEKSSGSSDMKQKKEKKEKSVKQLTLETREVGKSEEEDLEPAPVKNKRMDARAYRALFKKQHKKDNAAAHHEKRNRPDKLSQGGSSNCQGGVDGDDEFSEKKEELREESVGRACDRALVASDSSVDKFSKGTLEDNNGVELSHPSRGHSFVDKTCESEDGDAMEVSKKEFEDVDGMEVSKSGDSPLLSSYDAIAKDMIDDPGRVKVDCSVKQKLQTPEFILSALNEGTRDNCIDLEKCHEVIPSKRKRNLVDMDSVASAINASEDICTSIADVTSSSGCKRNDLVEICGKCCKRQRVDDGSTKQEFCSCNTKLSQELRDTSITKDRGKPGATVTVGLSGKCNDYVQQKESFVDQTGNDQNTCLVCKLGGKLLCCDGRGCKRSYHLSCLDHVPLGVWHCYVCVRKKTESGVHSVSEGIESIWDDKDVEESDIDGLQRQKQFFVKYKGLAHVHNCWVPESQLHLEAPSLLAKFNRKNQVTRWKQEWTLPHRLLQKRLLVSPRQRDENHEGPIGDSVDCHYEWLVKWRGLDYEHATWELENASFLTSSEGQGLIRHYENRRKNAKLASQSSKVNKLTAEGSPGFDTNHLDHVNKLRDFWHKGRNAIVIDDQERIVKVIAFISSLQPVVHKPFLVISTSEALYSWDHEFLRLAPSLDVVVFNGNEDMRKSIKMLEFYEEEGCLMFQVLITPPEVIKTDLDVLKCIKWEAIIVDECQCSIISSYFEHIKMLPTDLRLLVSAQLKDSRDEYLNLLSLLDSQSAVNNADDLVTSSNDNINKLKERLSRYIAYGCKSESSKFIEYWVPAQISNVQLEQYCATLLSNSMALRSILKNDSVGALRDILVSTRKCCDHPYIVDPSLQTLLTKGLQEVEYLDVGIKASGKLQLLDMMLMEIKNQGLRVLILFQTISGSGRDSIGDILDDFLRQRFGPDSYERIEVGILRSKKDAALNMFNNKESGRFVFLLECRACLPSIKLSSVDTVIIFDSDWTPMNNLRALQKLTLDSQFEQIKVFRLYSSFTVEENVLELAKQNKTFDSLQNISRSASHMLLMLRVSHLFDNLDKFHDGNTPSSSASTVSEQSFLKDVVREFLFILSRIGEDTDTSNLSIILKVKHVGGTYNTSSPLPGDLTIPLTDEAQPHLFWTKLLEGKHPRWKYSSGSSQRIRKRVQHADELPKNPEIESDEVVKKRKKVLNSNNDPPSLKPGVEGRIIAGVKEGASGTPAHTVSQPLPRSTSLVNDTFHAHHAPASPHLANNISELPKDNIVESEERRKLRDAQKSLHILLKPEIAKLCQILQLSEGVKGLAEKFLEYVMNYHNVNGVVARILQAFQISLCWTAASLLKHKIDHKESLALARQHLNFVCKKEEVDYVYSMLRCLKTLFLYHTGNFKVADFPKVSQLSTKDLTKDHSDANLSQSTTFNLQKVKVEVEDWSLHQESSDKQLLSQPGLALEFELAQKDVSKSIKDIQKKCDKKLTKLTQKQEEEKCENRRKYEEEMAQLETKHRMESAVIRTSFQSNISTRTDKLKMLDIEHAKRIEIHKREWEKRLNHIEEMQQAARNKVLERKARWVEEVKSWAQVELSNKTPSNEPGHGVKCLPTCEQVAAHNGPENVSLVSGHSSAEHSPDKSVHSLPGHGLEFSETQEAVPRKTVACSSPVETRASLQRPNGVSDEQNTVASEGVSVTGFKNCNGAGSSGNEQEKFDFPCCIDHNPDKGTFRKPDAEVPIEMPETVNSSDGMEKVVSMNLSSHGERIYDGATLRVSDDEVPMEEPETVCSSDGPEKVLSLNLPSIDEQIPDGATLSMPGIEIPLEVPEIVSSSDVRQTVVSVNQPSEEHTIDAISVLDEGGPLGVPETGTSSNGLENLLSVNPPSSDEQIPHGAYAVASDNSTRLDQQGEVGNTINKSSHSEELVLVSSPLVQPIATLAQSAPLLLNQALQDGCTLPSTPTGMLVGAPTCELHNTMPVEPSVSHPVDDVPSNELNCEAPAVEHVMQIQPSTDSHSCNSLPDLPSADGIEHQLSSEGLTSNQVCRTPMQVVQNPVELTNQVLQRVTSYALHPPIGGLGTHFSDTRTMAITTEISNRSIQTAPPMASRTPLPFYSDPLQNELERLHKETDQTIKMHEDTKYQLKSDCEREIEEVVTQIRRKYETKVQEMEAEFLFKKKELDANRQKVLMNKILAEAFRSKCMDLKVSGASGMQQDVNSSFIQQLVQRSSQQNAQRPSLVAGSSSASPPAASLQTTTAPASSLQTTSAMHSPHTTAPSVPAYHPSAVPTRPLHISSISPLAGNLQVGSGIRAPAPHLQPFRPTSISTSLPSFPRVLPSQQAPSNPATTSPSLSHLPPRALPGQQAPSNPVATSPPLSHPPPRALPSQQVPSNPATTSPSLSHLPPRAAAPQYQSGPYNRAQRLENVGGLPALTNPSLSVLELLVDVDSLSGANSLGNLPPRPELCSNLETLNISEFGKNSTAVDMVRTSGSADIVCLSDDD